MDRNIFHKNSQSIEKEEILTIIKRGGYISPTPLQEEVIPSVLQGKNLIIETGKDTGVTGSFLVPLLIKLDAHKDENKVIVFTSSVESVIKIEREFKRFSNRKLNRPTAAFLGYKDNLKKEIKTLKKKPDFIIGTTERIIDHLRRDNITLQHIQTAVITFSDAEENNSFEKDVLFVFSKLPKKFQIIMFLADMKYANPFIEIIKNPHIIKLEKIALAEDYKVVKNRSSSSNFKQSQEIENVSNNKTNFPENEDILNEKIKSIIKKIKEEEDPDELNRYKKIIRKNVPFSLRSYIGAYFLKEAAVKIRKPNNSFKSLFVSIGKSRRVYPKDLSRLFCSSLKIPVSGIGNIKVLDNYSFIDIKPDLADKAIETLNGTEYKGRKITVNYARRALS